MNHRQTPQRDGETGARTERGVGEPRAQGKDPEHADCRSPKEGTQETEQGRIMRTKWPGQPGVQTQGPRRLTQEKQRKQEKTASRNSRAKSLNQRPKTKCLKSYNSTADLKKKKKGTVKITSESSRWSKKITFTTQ